MDDDHTLDNDVYMVPDIEGGKVIMKEMPALTSINERLRLDYRADCQRGIDRYNKMLSKADIDFELTLPHTAFHRNIGTFAGINADPEGNIISQEEWDANVDNWMPTDEDRAFVENLMVPVTEPGKVAGWLAAPSRGIQGKDPDFEYVKFH